MIVGKNGNAVFQLIGIRVSSIVNEYHFAEISINHPQIFYVKSLSAEEAMLTEESMMHPLSIWVEIVYNNIRVAGMAGSEDYDLEVFA